jgi:hypothetical protein
VKIYEHPLDNKITVVEIEKVDEKTSYLEPVLDGFQQFGTTYPSSSYEDTNGKKVIYLDGRIRNSSWCDDIEILVMLAAQLGALNAKVLDTDPWSETLKLVQDKGEEDAAVVLSSKGSDYFEVFQTMYHIDTC